MSRLSLPASRRARGAPLASSIALVLAFTLILAGALAAGTSRAAQTTRSDVRVNQVTTADQHEPALAVDPTNPNNVLSAAKDWRTGPKQVWHYRSTDGGSTWADGHISTFPSELPNQSDPAIAFDSSGAAYMSVLAYNQNDFNVGGLFISRSNDDGGTWQQPVLVSANSETYFNDKEWITTDRSNNPATKGNVYTTWTLFTTLPNRTERGDIVISRSTDGGKTFSPRGHVSPQSQTNSQGSFPAVGPNGEVYVLYFSGLGAAADPDMSPGTAPAGQAARDALFVAKSTDGGLSFPQVARAAAVTTPPSPLPGSKFRMFVLPSLAVDPSGGVLYATWNDYASGESDIMLVHSTDGGLTWSAPLKVNDDSPSSRHDHFFPMVKVSSDGAVHELWLDRRADPKNKLYQPYYAKSTDHGVTFAKNAPVSLTQSNPDIGFEGTLIGDYVSLDLSNDAASVYTTWVDTRGGNQDIYFSEFPSSTGPAAAPAVVVQPTPVAIPSPQPLTGFADDAFLKTWERADQPVTIGKVSRPWLWGPAGFAAAQEPYAQSATGTRQVEYFDKARMEINNPNADRASLSYVTNGLLVVEMVSGKVQTGDNQFEPSARPPATIPVAGDANSPDALTYASLAPVASLANDKRVADKTGQAVTATLDRSGTAGDNPALAGTVKLAHYEPVLGHNIPDVFWNFMNATGLVFNGNLGTYRNEQVVNWVSDLGYPITEPYWTYVTISGAQKWVLVQAFQRRVLTYVADNPPGWQVEMGNVGRHYFDWRYRLTTAPRRGSGR